MFSCRKAFERISNSYDRKLSGFDKLCLWLHLTICSACRRAKKQLVILHRFGSDIPNSMDDTSSEIHLPDESKKAIEQAIKDHFK